MMLYTISTPKLCKVKLTSGSPYKRLPLFELELPDIAAGDLFHVAGEFQVTSEYPFAVMVGCGIRLNGEKIVENNGSNIVAKMHHYVASRSMWWRADRDLPGPNHFELVVYAASTRATAGSAIAVDSGLFQVVAWGKIRSPM